MNDVEQAIAAVLPDVFNIVGDVGTTTARGTYDARIPQGQRNSYLASLAGTMRRPGMTAEAIYAALAVENQRRCNPPLSDAEVQAIAQSIGRYAPTQGEPVSTFPIFNDVELLNRPKARYVVDGVLLANTFVPICGPTDAFKTFLVTCLGLSIATGRHWFGAAITAPGPAGIILAEGAGLYANRIAAWKVEHDIPLDTVVGFHTIPTTVNFMDAREVDALIEHLLPLGLRVLFVDTLARAMCGSSENDPADMGAFVRQCDRIRSATGAIVSPIHHTGWDESRERGHSSLRGSADTMFMVRRSDDEITVGCEKQKDAAPFPDLKLRLKFVPDADGCLLVPSGDVPQRVDLTPTQRRAMEVFRAAFSAQGATGTVWIKATGMKDGNGWRTIAALADAGYVEQRDKRGRYFDTGKRL